MTLTFTAEAHTEDGVVERAFTLDGIPGILWTPASPAAPVPLILLGHPGGLEQLRPRLAGRARTSVVELGCAAATVELPGKGDRPVLAEAERARADLREAFADGSGPTADIIDRLILPLVEQAVPEWQQLIDELLALPDIEGPVAYSGGVIAVGVRLAVVEPRIVAAGLFAGSFVPAATLAEARQVAIPLHVLLQWDDAGNDRQAALDLFDAFGSQQKTLQANLGGHTGVPAWAGEDAARFFARHLRPAEG
ncbi:hypothetical protein GCM10022237_28720 [Nocardioides ginsengisoli]|uniref:Alpha/beta hydrolase n=1 Tax=Nocardioides ginsengisoli TaxID=363868 RepID=A0ABW3W4X8_9ACTN